MNLTTILARLREAGTAHADIQTSIEADYSHDEQRRALYTALRALGGTESDHYTFRYIEAVYDSFIVYSEQSDDASERLLKAEYSIAEDGTATIGIPVPVRMEYVPVVTETAVIEALAHGEAPQSEAQAVETATTHGDVLRLIESTAQGAPGSGAPDGSGRVKIKLISTGWNKSRTTYYSEEALRTTGPAGFPIGTLMFWNHPTASESIERPERDLTYLAAKVATTPEYLTDGPTGPGLYAYMEVSEAYAERIADIGEWIGLSIYALAAGYQGEAEGHEGRIIQAFIPDPFNTVDFVTVDGAGGEILRQFEAAGRSAEPLPSHQEEEQVTETQAAELQAENQRLSTEAARLREAVQRNTTVQARTFASETLATVEMPDASRTRVVESVVAAAPRTESGELDQEAFKTQIEAAATAELTYLQQATGYGTGEVQQLGAAAPAVVTESATPAPVADVRTSLGLS